MDALSYMSSITQDPSSFMDVLSYMIYRLIEGQEILYSEAEDQCVIYRRAECQGNL